MQGAFCNALGSSLAGAMSNASSTPTTGDFGRMDRANGRAYDEMMRTSGDFARMDGAGYRSTSYEEPMVAGTGLQFGRSSYGLNAPQSWGSDVYAGIQNVAAGYDRSTDFAAGPPRPGMTFTDAGWQNVKGMVSVGRNGEPIALGPALFSPANPANPLNPLSPAAGGFAGGNRQEQATGAPGYNPVTDMPSGTPSFPGLKLPAWLGSPPSIQDVNDFLGKGLGTAFPIAKPAIELLRLCCTNPAPRTVSLGT
jgi:hypothetical protein